MTDEENPSSNCRTGLQLQQTISSRMFQTIHPSTGRMLHQHFRSWRMAWTRCRLLNLLGLITSHLNFFNTQVEPQPKRSKKHSNHHHLQGDRKVCGNYCGISLLSIAGKIFARILRARLQAIAENVILKSQCGFHASCGTINEIFCARQLREKKSWTAKTPFSGLLWPSESFWLGPESCHVVTSKTYWLSWPLHLTGSSSAQRYIWTNSPSKQDVWRITIMCHLKQGCVLAPTFFSLYLAAMLY